MMIYEILQVNVILSVSEESPMCKFPEILLW